MGHERTKGPDELLFLTCVLTPIFYSLSGPKTCIRRVQYPETSWKQAVRVVAQDSSGHEDIRGASCLKSHMEADILAWGISLREVLISPHAQ